MRPSSTQRAGVSGNQSHAVVRGVEMLEGAICAVVVVVVVVAWSWSWSWSSLGRRGRRHRAQRLRRLSSLERRPPPLRLPLYSKSANAVLDSIQARALGVYLPSYLSNDVANRHVSSRPFYNGVCCVSANTGRHFHYRRPRPGGGAYDRDENERL